MKDMLGIIAGSAFLRGLPDEAAEEKIVATDRGDVTVHPGDGFVFLRRHGHERYEPPHRVPHHAHALALQQLGVRRVVGLVSVGGLDAELEPGTIVVPDDYLSFHPPPTFAESERLHIVPSLNARLRALLLDVARTTEGPVRDGGVYAETRGPRFETRAEIRLLADYADYVGMTGASEATLLQERDIAYAMLGVVDNLAHGLDAEPLTLERFDAQIDANRDRARAIVRELARRCRP